MIEVNHIYALKSDWYNQFAEQLVAKVGAERPNNQLLTMQNDIAEGNSFYTDVIPGLSVAIIDFMFKESILINRFKGEDDLYVIHLDFSDEMNLIHINDEKYKIGYKANLGLLMLDNAFENSFQPVIGKRVYTMRLIVSKELLNFPIGSKGLRKSKKGKKVLFFNDHIDSESKLIMHDLKNKTVYDPGFDIHLRGIALRLLAKFIDRYSNLSKMEYHITDREIQALQQTNKYLLDNLLNEFPGIPHLADMAGMSITKYKSLFKKMFIDTPNNFFIREKMILANQLLQSGEFENVKDVHKYLSYKKTNYFTSKYFMQFGRKPIEDLYL
ncbi:AraC family transcriptional regulator [Flavobacterium sp. ACN6]|uniref:AraC family transcriptional regulator n=1 Tax=Flavobacterium sp. ACN6 TaxID=1920426 RepID=UPI000BB37120|nr:AraC family transcriptional regulator [Flavobacterium sp. ACN6]PBJ04601.1 hypothetical protein BSF42_44080 [Flavobacterium sp. ACN6]